MAARREWLRGGGGGARQALEGSSGKGTVKSACQSGKGPLSLKIGSERHSHPCHRCHEISNSAHAAKQQRIRTGFVSHLRTALRLRSAPRAARGPRSRGRAAGERGPAGLRSRTPFITAEQGRRADLVAAAQQGPARSQARKGHTGPVLSPALQLPGTRAVCTEPAPSSPPGIHGWRARRVLGSAPARGPHGGPGQSHTCPSHARAAALEPVLPARGFCPLVNRTARRSPARQAGRCLPAP